MNFSWLKNVFKIEELRDKFVKETDLVELVRFSGPGRRGDLYNYMKDKTEPETWFDDVIIRQMADELLRLDGKIKNIENLINKKSKNKGIERTKVKGKK